jgi:hypothetical protein
MKLEEVQKHVDYVKQQFSAAKRRTKTVLLIEEKVDITHLIEDGWDLRRYYNWKRYA